MISISEAASIVVALASVTAAVVSIRNMKSIQQVHVSINSRMDALLKSSGIAEFSKGLEQGRTETKP